MAWVRVHSFLLGILISTAAFGVKEPKVLCSDFLAGAYPAGLSAPVSFDVPYADGDLTPQLYLDVFDPHDHFARESPIFDLALHYPIVHDRILFVHQRLHARHRRVDVVIKYWRTDWQYSEEPADGDNSDDFHRVALLFADTHLSEHPDSALVGLVSELMFEELKALYPRGYDDLEAAQVARLSAEGYAHLGEEKLKETIRRVLRLRTAWYNKFEYYKHGVRPTQSYRLPFMELLMAAEGEGRLDEAVKEQFAAFYHLEADLVNRLWTVPLPDLWEHAFAAPPVWRQSQRQGSVK